MSRVVICGKGGVGKTTITALLAEALADQRPLIVDADPVGRLGRALGVAPEKTVAEVLEPLIERRGVDRAAIGTQAVRELLTPVPGVGSLLAMGVHHRRGCFCSINRLLRLAVDTVAGEFNLVLLDAEGGAEHINRATAGTVHYLIVVAEPTVAAMEVALALSHEAEQFLSPTERCLVLNQTRRPRDPDVEEEIWNMMALHWQNRIWITMPHSPAIATRQAKGQNLLGIEDQSLQDAVRPLARWIRGEEAIQSPTKERGCQ